MSNRVRFVPTTVSRTLSGRVTNRKQNYRANFADVLIETVIFTRTERPLRRDSITGCFLSAVSRVIITVSRGRCCSADARQSSRAGKMLIGCPVITDGGGY